uniref:Uncharacterized protein n=1 Tax=Archaeoglobus fulgidus TaxID=2234 RepID=A0A7C2S5V3_ARCFL
MRKRAVRFCAECLNEKFIVDSIEGRLTCMECHSEVYFETTVSEKIVEEVTTLCRKFKLDGGALLLVYAAAGIIQLRYVDCKAERYSREAVLSRIFDGISEEGGFYYEPAKFQKIIEFLEKSGENVKEERLKKLRAVLPNLKEVILAELL